MTQKITRNINQWNTFVSITLMMLYFFALVVIFILPFRVYEWSNRPFPGFVVEQTVLVASYTGSGWGVYNRLMNLDQIISINDRSVNSIFEYESVIRGLKIGETLEIRVIHQDGSREIIKNIQVENFPSRDLLRLFWLPFGMGVVYYVMGLWVFFKRGNTFSGQAFTFFCVCTAMAIVLLFDVVTTHLWVNLWSTSVAQLGGALICVSLFFPEPLESIKKRLWLVAIPLGISFLLAIWSAWENYDTVNAWNYITPWKVNYIYTAAGIIIFFVVLFFRLHKEKSLVATQQIRITLWGSLFSFFPSVIWFLTPVLGISIPFNPAIFVPSLVLFPMAIGLTIAMYRLWDLELIINRTLVYSLLSVILGGIFILGIVLIDGLVLGRVQERSAYSIAISSMAIAFTFNPLRIRLQRFIDRRFFRLRYDTNRALANFSLSARQIVDLDQLQAGLIRVLQQTIQPTKVVLYSYGKTDTQTAFNIQADDPLKTALQSSRLPLDVGKLNMLSSALETLRKDNFVLTIPLISQSELIGVINLGKKRSGQPYTTEDRTLLQMLSAQVAPALRVAQLVRQYQAQSKTRQRIMQEMELAREVQESILQKSFPKYTGLAFAARIETARQVGGDFYTVLGLDDENVGLIIADVSDKGIPAALYMAMTRSLLVSLARNMQPPGKLLQEANEMLQELSTSDMFVTVFYGVINKLTLKMCYSRAGHDYPLLIRNSEVQILKGQGMALGVLKGAEFINGEDSIQLEKGDRLVFYTDGITDVIGSDGKMFGLPRLQLFLSDNAHLPIEDFCSSLFKHLTIYRGNEDLFDDMTMLVVDIEK